MTLTFGLGLGDFVEALAERDDSEHDAGGGVEGR